MPFSPYAIFADVTSVRRSELTMIFMLCMRVPMSADAASAIRHAQARALDTTALRAGRCYALRRDARCYALMLRARCCVTPSDASSGTLQVSRYGVIMALRYAQQRVTRYGYARRRKSG